MLGMRITPWPLFIASWYATHVPISNGTIKPVKTERYWLNWMRNLYDTHGLYHGVRDTDDSDNIILLPADGFHPVADPVGSSGVAILQAE